VKTTMTQREWERHLEAKIFVTGIAPVRSSELVVLSRKGVMPVNHATNCQCEMCRMTFKGQRRGASHPPKYSNAQHNAKLSGASQPLTKPDEHSQ
jgi:hypothetical protein